MNRWLAAFVIVLTLTIGWAAYAFPNLIPGRLGAELPSLIYLLLALLLVAGAGYGFPRLRQDGRRAVISILVWAGLIGALVLAYNAFN